jgi:hypothetical protein
MKLNKKTADFVWGEGKLAWICSKKNNSWWKKGTPLEEENYVVIKDGDDIIFETIKDFRANYEEAFAADEKHVVEYGDVVIEHTLCKEFHDPLFKAIDIIEGAFAIEASPGKLAEKLYKIEFPRGVVTLEFRDQVILINSFEDGLDRVVLFNHLINQAGMKYNLSADEIGRYSLVPPLEWNVIGYKTKIYPISDEVYKLYQQLKEYPDDVYVIADDFIQEPMDFKVRVNSEFMGEIELDLSDRKDKVGFLYNMLSMVFGTKGSREKIIDLDKKYDLEERNHLEEGSKATPNDLLKKGIENFTNKELLGSIKKYGMTGWSSFGNKGALEELEERLEITPPITNWWDNNFEERIQKVEEAIDNARTQESSN